MSQALPETAQELLEVLDQEGLAILVEYYGGGPVQTHKRNRLRLDSDLAVRLGADRYRMLCEHYDGERIAYVPLLDTSHAEVLRADVIARVDSGESWADVARRYRLSIRTIARYLARDRDSSQQAEHSQSRLFD